MYPQSEKEKREVKKEKLTWEKFKELEAIESPAGDVSAAAFFPGGKVMAGVEGNIIRTWQSQTGEELNKFEAPEEVFSLASTPDSNIAYGGPDGMVRILNPRTGEQLKEMACSAKGITAVGFSPEGNVIYGGGDGLVGVLDTQSGQELKHFETKTGGVSALGGLADNRVVVGGVDGFVRVINTQTGEEILSLKLGNEPITSLAVTPDTFIAGDEKGTIKIWARGTAKEVKTLEGHSDAVTAITFIEENKRIQSASKDGTMRTWGTK